MFGAGNGHYNVVSENDGRTTMGTRDVRLPKSRDQSQIEVEYILQPLDGGGRLVSENLDEVGSRFVTGRL